MVKEVFSLSVWADTRCKTPRFTVRATGEDDDHLMDWRGCNFKSIQVGHPVHSVTEAREQMKAIYRAVNEALKTKTGDIIIDGKPVGRACKGLTGDRYVSFHGQGRNDRDTGDPREVLSVVWGCTTDPCHPKDIHDLTQAEWDELRQEVKDDKKERGGGSR